MASRGKVGSAFVAIGFACLLLFAVLPVNGQDPVAFTVTGAKTLDRDSDGHLDAIELRFSAELMQGAIDMAQFRVTAPNYSIIGYEFSAAENNVLLLYLAPGLSPDTGRRPTVTVEAGAVRSSAEGNPSVAAFSGVAQDGAPPVLLVAYAKRPVANVENKDFVLWFSEPVRGQDGALTHTAFAYNSRDSDPDPEAPANEIAGVPPGKEHKITDAFVWLRALHNFTTYNVDMADFILGDTISIQAQVTDGAGNVAVHRGGESAVSVPVAIPYLVSADGNIGKPFMLLRFNGPIGGLTPFDIGVVKAQDGAISGVNNVTAPVGATIVAVTVDKAVVPADVSTTPAKLRIQEGRVSGMQIGEFVIEKEVPLWDVTPPKLNTVTTRDLDDSGFINAFALDFSEPIDDTVVFNLVSFLLPADPDIPNDKPILFFCANPAPIPLDDVLDFGFADCSLDTGAKIYDDRVFLQFSGLTKQTALGVYAPHPGMRTDALPMLRLEAGAFHDLVRRDATSDGGPAIPNGNGSDFVDFGAVPTRDGAPPRVLSAITQDGNGDGYIDGYVLTFTEPIDRSTFNSAHWFVDGHENIVLGSVANLAPDQMRLSFSPQAFPAHGTTGDVPEIFYLPPSGSGLKDIVGNIMKSFREGGVVEEDGARPVLLRAYAQAGDRHILVEFSEGVTRVDGSALSLQEFLYAHVGGKGLGINRVDHIAGERFATLHLNGLLSASDILSDAVTPSSEFTIMEVGGGLSVPTTTTKFSEPVDRIPPGRVDLLQVVAANTTANSVTLRLTAPGNDGEVGGPVDGYEVRIAKQPILTLGRYDESPRAELLSFNPSILVGPGQQQEITVLGLDPGTDYHFAVKAMDAAGHLSEEKSPSVTAKTLVDTTPPEGICDIRFMSVVKGTQGRSLTVVWSAFEDPQSVPVYRYALSHDASRPMTEMDPRTTATTLTIQAPWAAEPWNLILVPESAGGAAVACVATLPPFPEDPEYYAGHSGTVLTATHHRGVFELNWQLPNATDLPGDVIGVSLWRFSEDGQARLVTSMRGSYEDLRFGRHIDLTPGASRDHSYALAMEFAQRPGFPSSQSPPDSELIPMQAVDHIPLIKWWMWLIIGLAAVLLVVGLVVVLRNRSQASEWDETEELDEDELRDIADQEGWQEVGEGESDNPGGDEEAGDGGLPVHNVNCPRCSQAFTAQGHRPVAIECPHCGVKGTL